MENFFTPLPIPQFLERLKDKHHGNMDFYTMKEWKPTLSFGEITLDFIQQFHNHELEVGNILSTVYKKHSNLKFLIGIAVDKKKLVKNPYEKFEIKKNIKT